MLKKGNFVDLIKVYRLLLKSRDINDIDTLKEIVRNIYYLADDLNEKFYLELMTLIQDKNFLKTFVFGIDKDIYKLISYMRFNSESSEFLKNFLSPQQYFSISKKYINQIVNKLNEIECLSWEEANKKSNKALWMLRKDFVYSDEEKIEVAYKMYLSIGLDNSLELLNQKYGDFTYNDAYYLFSNLNVNNRDENNLVIQNFLFNNKKENSIVSQMLNQDLIDLYLNFVYFYNSIDYFISKLGTKLPIEKVMMLINERVVPQRTGYPEVSADIVDDMISSYFNKYGIDESEQEIIKKNFSVYEDILKKKKQSSIPSHKVEKDGLTAEVVPLSDPKNLVMGYRAGNCFRLNGEAFVLFNNFLSNPHMRLVSISSEKNKDYAMMLIMRNGNLLISQGIEVSKRIEEDELRGQKLYDICRLVMKELMNKMNDNGDEIVATIVGATNYHVTNYNNTILPFLISPIIDNAQNFYNGISNYQCLWDLKEGKSIKDIKLFVPLSSYCDKRNKVCEYYYDDEKGLDYQIERTRKVDSLRFWKLKDKSSEEMSEFFDNLIEKEELVTYCTDDWYIVLYKDGYIDSFISSNDKRAYEEYEEYMRKIENIKISNNSLKKIWQILPSNK